MIDLYAAPTSNGIRVKIMLEECGLDYTLKLVDVFKGAHKTAEFRALNPQGLTPVIVDHDGPGGQSLTLTQSGAILSYLAEKSGKFGDAGPADRAHFGERYLNIISDAGAILGTIFAIGRMEEPHKATLEIFETRFKSDMGVWDAELGKRAYCGGDEISIADFAMFGTLVRCKGVTPHLIEGRANIARWYEAMEGREGVKRGLDFGG